MKTKIKVGDRVKCYVSTTKLDGKELIVTKHWALGIVYHIGDTVLAFKAEDGHNYGVKIKSVSLV